jgi:ribosomal small subunit protein bTHX
MGKGDKRSAKGKRVVGSYGNSRPKAKKIETKVVAKPKKKTVK